MKFALVQMADQEQLDLSDIGRIAFSELIARRKPMKRVKLAGKTRGQWLKHATL